jgi:hypothetical protein
MRLLAALLASIYLLAAGAATVQAQQGQAQPAAQQPAAKPLSEAQLEQLVAPIALYPDALLAQVLMAATYPLEIVEAERWAEQNKGLSGAQLTQALAGQNWDPSVKALVSTPSVLEMMNAKLDWVQQLGNAVVAQQAQVMQAVQALRQKAQTAGNLKSTKQQNVATDGAGSAIVIEPAEPQTIYVPYYDPAVVYGVWAYPAYPPYIFPAPVGWVAGPGLWFGAGFALGVAWDHWGNWGAFNWHDGNIYVHGNVNNHWNVDVNRRVNVNNVNVNVDKSIDADVNKLDDRSIDRADDNIDRNVDRAGDDVDRNVDRADDDVSRDLNRDLERDDDLDRGGGFRDDGFGRDGGFGRDDFGGGGRGGGRR